jgi:putative colanic acid biosynthesis acetyltransferase WcaF
MTTDGSPLSYLPKSVGDGAQHNPVRQDGRGQPNPYTRAERAARVLWLLAYWTAFRCIPRVLNGWHRQVLRAFGARVGRGVCIYPSTRIECPWNLSLGNFSVVGSGVRLYALGPIAIGEHAVLSQRAHLCAGSHDYRDPRMPLLRPAISLGNGVWVCTEAFIGPGTTVGDRTVIGARAVVTRDMPPDTVCAGNPCRPLKPRTARFQ